MIDAQVQQADALRSIRAFIGGAYFQDQSPAGQDGYAMNQPLQYQSISRNGAVGQEGAPGVPGAIGALLSPAVMLLGGLALLAYMALRK